MTYKPSDNNHGLSDVLDSKLNKKGHNHEKYGWHLTKTMHKHNNNSGSFS